MNKREGKIINGFREKRTKRLRKERQKRKERWRKAETRNGNKEFAKIVVV